MTASKTNPTNGSGILRHYTKALSVALRHRDPATLTHSERVESICEAIGRRLRLGEQEMDVLSVGAVFHDIGKIGIPDRILLKPLALEEPEIEIMRTHPQAGAEIILATELEGSEEVARVIRHHHEHYDGNGYPDQLAGDAIPLASRIISIADSYEAMAGRSLYRKPKPHARIMQILDDETGAKHDPHVMDIFKEVIEDSPLRASA
ncbi:MAG: HD domain-containing protein [Thermoanaerobaculia bacterium]|nr:HD domain-containing protein [Thermoanaerobaculia bacterium]